MEFDFSVVIRRPPEAVYAFLADIQRHVHAPGSPVREMVKMPPAPTAVGTRWREVIQLTRFATMTVWSEVTAAHPGRRLEMTFQGPGMRGKLIYTLRRIDGGTELQHRETLTLVGPMRLLSRPLARMLGPRLADRLQDIRQQLETDRRRDSAALTRSPAARSGSIETGALKVVLTRR